MKVKKRMVSIAMASVLCVALSSCGEKTASKKADIDLSDYPIKTDVELTYWVDLNPNIAAQFTNKGETEYEKELQKRTGVKVKYVHPAAGQTVENFNLLAASGELPDIVEHGWIGLVSGGPQGALQNKTIIPLNDLLKEYAPNLSKYLQENPDIDRMIKTDDGSYYAFPLIRGDEKLFVSYGPVVRADWLNELGLDKPVTLEDWEEMLRAFRDKKGATAPLTISPDIVDTPSLFALFGVKNGFYIEDGKVKFGIVEDGFKEALARVKGWYQEGLLDKNYALTDDQIKDSNILNGLSGATFGSGAGGLGRWLNAKKGEEYDLCAVAFPLIDGEPNRFSRCANAYTGEAEAAITTNCKYPELAAKYLDYVYGEEGHMFANFGIEGLSYEMVDGFPKYTDLIMKNPDGLPASQVMSNYVVANMGGPHIQDVRYIEQYYEKPQQKEALVVWSAACEKATKANMPPLTYSSEESSEYASLYADIEKYCNESLATFISGAKSLDEFDDFVNTLKKMKLDRVIEIQQAAYDRFMAR